jgi:hypothetical protein
MSFEYSAQTVCKEGDLVITSLLILLWCTIPQIYGPIVNTSCEADPSTYRCCISSRILCLLFCHFKCVDDTGVHERWQFVAMIIKVKVFPCLSVNSFLQWSQTMALISKKWFLPPVAAECQLFHIHPPSLWTNSIHTSPSWFYSAHFWLESRVL